MTFHELMILVVKRFVVEFSRGDSGGCYCVLRMGDDERFDGYANTPDGALVKACEAWREALKVELAREERSLEFRREIVDLLQGIR